MISICFLGSCVVFQIKGFCCFCVLFCSVFLWVNIERAFTEDLCLVLSLDYFKVNIASLVGASSDLPTYGDSEKMTYTEQASKRHHCMRLTWWEHLLFFRIEKRIYTSQDMKKSALGWGDGLVGKGFFPKPDDLSLISGTHGKQRCSLQC